jgi:hypothetical protein
VDLGQRLDYTAVVIAEVPVWIPGGPEAFARGWAPTTGGGWTALGGLTDRQRRYWRERGEAEGRPPDPPLLVRHIERFREVAYTAVTERVARLLATPPLAESATTLLVDQTGVGVAVVDGMRAAGLRPVGITIHGGDAIHADRGRGEVSVPKSALISSTQVLLEQRRLRVAPDLAHAGTLLAELRDYEVRINPAGHAAFSARSGQHDDLVLAAALVGWWYEWFYWHVEERHRVAHRAPMEEVTYA